MATNSPSSASSVTPRSTGVAPKLFSIPRREMLGMGGGVTVARRRRDGGSLTVARRHRWTSRPKGALRPHERPAH